MSPEFFYATTPFQPIPLPTPAVPPPDLMQFAAEDIRAMVHEVLG